MVIKVAGLGELPDAAAQVLASAGERRVFLFYGEMGAGKTTLISALCAQLGVVDATSSPTFAIVNEYTFPKGVIYHFDFYRIKSAQEAFDMGYEDYFFSGNYCFVEWPEKIAGLWPEDALTIHVTVLADGSRQLEIS